MTFIKCSSCDIDIPVKEKCIFAIHSAKIEGKKYFFCCEKCAENFVKKKRIPKK